MTCLEVDDAEAAHRKPGAIAEKRSGVVGATMHDLLVHLEQRCVVGALVGCKVKDAADAAHRNSLPRRRADGLRRRAERLERRSLLQRD